MTKYIEHSWFNYFYHQIKEVEHYEETNYIINIYKLF
ncbi:hypothetical protein GGR97_000950 [Wenyingzhuangia aestuarii]|nr:hypothetical protein [Wenyingzhuangia aestuarii]